jgi:hypothetical protein
VCRKTRGRTEKKDLEGTETDRELCALRLGENSRGQKICEEKRTEDRMLKQRKGGAGGIQIGRRFGFSLRVISCANESPLNRNPGKTIKYFTTFTNTIYDVLSSRGWEEAEADEDVSPVPYHS